MKKTALLVALLYCLMIPSVSAQSSTPVPTDEAEQNEIQKKISDLKDRLATRVAELKSQTKKSFTGVVKSKEDGILTITQKDLEVKVVFDTTSSVFVVSSAGKRTASDTKSITVGQSVTVFGSLDLDQKTVIAKVLIISEPLTVLSGIVDSIDIKEGSLTIDSQKGKLILDYEINTKCLYFDKEKSLVTCGLSKITPGDRLVVRFDQKDNSLTRATALRMVVIPRISPSVTTKPSSGLSSPTASISAKPL